MENKLFNKPVIDRLHPIGNGFQKIYHFPNNYGASVVRFKLLGRFGSYTTDESEFELAVLKFAKLNNHEDFKLTYETPITDDVIGHLKIKEVEEILNKIKNL